MKLLERLKLPGCWKVGLCDIHMTENIGQPVYICSSLTSSFIIGGSLSPVLRHIPDTRQSFVFEKPYYIRVDEDEYDMIEIYITDSSMKNMSFEVGRVTCTLHFKQE